MTDLIQKLNSTRRSEWRTTLTLAIVLLPVMFGTIAKAQEAGQKTFATLQDASTALYQAAKSGDKAVIESVLGASSASVISSGDAVVDQKNADDFIRRYEQMNRWGKEVNGDQTLFLGAENWPFPIPLKKDAGGQWYFDTKAGLEEILYRRIGRNEYAAIRICGVLADAQMDYSTAFTMARRSTNTRKNSSAIQASRTGFTGKPPKASRTVPIGPLIAYASGEGYKDKDAAFHGYFFRVLTSRGPKAPGGAKNYIVNGAMTGGFAFLAYPATYRNSGVMTFLVDSQGVIYEKDLGPKTADAARRSLRSMPISLGERSARTRKTKRRK